MGYDPDSVAAVSFSMPSVGGGVLYCRQWSPVGEPWCLVQLVHGIAEHIGRYDEFARYLATRGILVVAEDHMGHGGSISPESPQGYFAGGWEMACDDVFSLMEQTRGQYPGVPYVLFGHSMGSFLVRTVLYRHRDRGPDGAILCGTAWQPPLLMIPGKWLCQLISGLGDDKKVSPLLRKLIFGGYLDRIQNPATQFDWISSLPEAVQKYAEDPLCGFSETCGLDRELLRGTCMNQKMRNLQAMDPRVPIYFIAGTEDPVGLYGKGVCKAVRAFQQVGMEDISLSLYPENRHDILHDRAREQVFCDVFQWISRQFTLKV